VPVARKPIHALARRVSFNSSCAVRDGSLLERILWSRMFERPNDQPSGVGILSMNGTPPQSFSSSRALSSPSGPSTSSTSSSSHVTSNEVQSSLTVVSSAIPGSSRLGRFVGGAMDLIGPGDGPPGQVEQELHISLRKPRLFGRKDTEPEKTFPNDLAKSFAKLLPPLQQVVSDYCGPYPADLPVTVSDFEAAGFAEIDISEVVLSPERYPPATEVWFPNGMLATRAVVLGRKQGCHDMFADLRVRFTNPEYASFWDRNRSGDCVGVIGWYGAGSRHSVWVNTTGAPVPLKDEDVATLETPAYLLISTDFLGGRHQNEGPHAMAQSVLCTKAIRLAPHQYMFRFESAWAPQSEGLLRTDAGQWGRPAANQAHFLATRRVLLQEMPDWVLIPPYEDDNVKWYQWETIINLTDPNIRLLRDPSVKVRQTAPAPVSDKGVVLRNSPLQPTMGEEEDMEPGMLSYAEIQALGINDRVAMEAFQKRSGTYQKGTYLMKVEQVFNSSGVWKVFNEIPASTRLVLSDTRGRRVRMSVTANSLPNLQLRTKAARPEDTARFPEPEAEGRLPTVSRFMPLRQKKGVTSPEAAPYSQINALQPGDPVTIWALDRGTRNRSYQHATVHEVSPTDSDRLDLLLRDTEGNLIVSEVRKNKIPILWIGDAARKREDSKSLSRHGDHRTTELGLDVDGEPAGLITIEPRDNKSSSLESALLPVDFGGGQVSDEHGLITLEPGLSPPPGDHNFAVAFAGGLRLECPVSKAKLLDASSGEPVTVMLGNSDGQGIKCVCLSARSVSDQRRESLTLELQTNEGMTESILNSPLIDSIGSETSGSTRFRLNMELPR
jgi:hypothetical protein